MTKEEIKAKRIKIVKILSPIGGALVGYLYSRGSLPMQYPKSPTKKQMIVSIVIGTLIGFGFGYLGAKKIEKETK